MNPMLKKPKKPPACDACKARRVLCHPQPGGAPCPRCVERKISCMTTGVPRGRPRKYAPQFSLSLTGTHQFSGPMLPSGPEFGASIDCPDLSPELVAHCFEKLKVDPRFTHPLLSGTSIIADIRAVSFQLHLLPPQSRVLALCIVAYGSLWSFHTSVLGNGPHPESFLDHAFFASQQELLNCGVRRAPAYRALRAQAQKAAWEIGAILVASNENAASCYLLDLMNQIDLYNPRHKTMGNGIFRSESVFLYSAGGHPPLALVSFPGGRISLPPPVPGSAAYVLTLAFSGLVLPFYRELQYRENRSTDDTLHVQRLRVLREQAHDVAVLGAREFARGIRYLPKIHHLPFQWPIVLAWAEFMVEEAGAWGDSPLSLQAAQDLEMCVY
ncbi:Zn(2)-C6 fungal-type domain-containing protein [Mycena sanguinolenta]|uniref:Zn(2)-C6 fungal-type domain-containing protein n=1 Tax=Mycena sanguinolenta TaxID=230812 RepID=A0A8H7CPF4_9AGAR|nr:Zn(2)-C6 fungal-type domain-containing protein [Mycena sanguinolenta]